MLSLSLVLNAGAAFSLCVKSSLVLFLLVMLMVLSLLIRMLVIVVIATLVSNICIWKFLNLTWLADVRMYVCPIGAPLCTIVYFFK